jgi:hypothetical protein
MRTIRASELGNFLFCQRAWWYHLSGVQSQNQAELSGGSAFHHRHGRAVILASLLHSAGWLLILSALVILAIGLTLAAIH